MIFGIFDLLRNTSSLLPLVMKKHVQLELKIKICTAWKVSKYGVISVPYFPVFGLNTEIYGVNDDKVK